MMNQFYRKVRCQYCEQMTKVVQGRVLYGDKHKLSNLEFYYCEPCKAWVGMHVHSKKPFGTVANSELRKRRVWAHQFFDKLWMNNQDTDRKAAYAWLAKNMGVSEDKCHIGNFDLDQCMKVIILSKMELKKKSIIKPTL